MWHNVDVEGSDQKPPKRLEHLIVALNQREPETALIPFKSPRTSDPEKTSSASSFIKCGLSLPSRAVLGQLKACPTRL